MFFIRYKVREEKNMKRVKRLLVMLCIIALGVTAVPARAEIIEVDKPAEPKEVTVQEVKLDKAVYRVGESPILMIKFNGLSNSDISNITSVYVKGQRLLYALKYGENGYFQGELNPCVEEGRKGITITGVTIKSNDIKIAVKSSSINLRIITNNNCSDGNHTIYKDNWQMEEYATCVKKGLQTIRCNICNQIVRSEEIPMTPHKISGCQIRPENGKKYAFYLCSCGKIMDKKLFSSESEKNKADKKVEKQKKKIVTSKLKFVKKSISIKRGKTTKLKYIRKPINAQDILIWKSSNPKVVKIMKNGKIKGLKRGRAIITVRTITGKRSKIIVKVK